MKGLKVKPWSITLSTPSGDRYVFELDSPPVTWVDYEVRAIVPAGLSEARANLQASLAPPIEWVRFEFKPVKPVRHTVPRRRS